MSNSYRARGDLCALCTKTETAYGTPVEGNADYSGTLLTIKDSDTSTYEPWWTCGSRLRAGQVLKATGTGYNATFRLASAQNQTKAWFAKAGVSSSISQRTLTPFSTVLKVASNEYHLFTGSSVDTLTVSASEVGGFVECAVNVKARHHALATATSAFKDADGATALADIKPVAVPNSVPVTYSKYWKVDNEDVRATSWSIEVKNSLVSHDSLSATSNGHSLEDGEQPSLGEFTATVTLTFPSTGMEWDVKRLARGNDHTLVLSIDGATITCSNCTIDPSGASRTAEGGYDESIVFDVGSMTVA